jgi:PDZ domain
VYAQGNTFHRVRYNGGSIPSKVDPKDWGNKLIVTSDAITIEFKDRQSVVILAKSVTALAYGQEAHRRVGTMIALAILVAPVALFGLFHKTRLHFIGIQYVTSDHKSAGILLQGDKDNYRAMLVALQGVSEVPVSVGEKERGFIPVGVTTTVSKDSGEIERAEINTVAPKTESPAAPAGKSTMGASSAGNPTIRHDGITLTSVVPGGPADRAGIKPGDVVLAINDHYLYTAGEMSEELRRYGPGTTISVRYLRYSIIYDIAVVLEAAQ